MLTGRLPFESSSAFELVRLYRDENPPPVTAFRADVPPGLAGIVTAAMAKDPSLRPPDGTALHELLTRLSRGTTAATEVIEPPRRRRTPRPLLVGLLGALALAGAALAWDVTPMLAGCKRATRHCCAWAQLMSLAVPSGYRTGI